MKKPLVTMFAAAVLNLSNNLYAYDLTTHRELTEQAVDRSAIMLNADILSNLGIVPFGSKQTFPSFEDKALTIKELLGEGSVSQDTGFFIARTHFYDPINDVPLRLRIPGTCALAPVPFSVKSPAWALEDTDDYSTQPNSYLDAKDNLVAALIEPTESERKKLFGRFFENLGHVLHHIQDMAQPEHVRSDQHLKAFGFKSRYEAYTEVESRAKRLNYAGYAPVRFPNARSFWHTDDIGLGIADYTNRNFVSNNTNFTTASPGVIANPCYANPVPDNTESVDIKTLIPGTTLSGKVLFVSNFVLDAYPDRSSQPNARAATYSLFDDDLKGKGFFRVFTLNRFNFKVANDLLIPRAVGYGAGLLNYFFRGRMQISLPEGGLYSVLDYSTLTTGTRGFSTIKLKLKNTTPDIVVGNQRHPQDMGPGTLRLIARYHQNMCFKLNLSDTLNTGTDLASCRSVQEFYSVSAPVSINAIPKDIAEQFTFTLTTPVSVAAVDMYFQVLYQGSLGQEQNAIAVAAKDVAEPTYLEFVNATDYGLFFDNHLYTNEEILADPNLSRQLDRDGDGIPDVALSPPAIQNFAFGIGSTGHGAYNTMPAARFSRFAVLTDYAPFIVTAIDDVFGVSDIPFVGRIMQLDHGTDPGPDDDRFLGHFTRKIRNVYMWDPIFYLYTYIFNPNIDLNEMTVRLSPFPFPSLLLNAAALPLDVIPRAKVSAAALPQSIIVRRSQPPRQVAIPMRKVQ